MSQPDWYPTPEPGTSEQVQAPAGFYPDPDGIPGLERWWNGVGWSEQTRRPQPVPPAPTAPAMHPAVAGVYALAGQAQAKEQADRARYGRLAGIRVNGRQATPASLTRFGVIWLAILSPMMLIALVAFEPFMILFLLGFASIGIFAIRTGRKAAAEQDIHTSGPARPATPLTEGHRP